MNIEKLLNETREKYDFYFIDMENDQIYYLLDDPALCLTEGKDPLQVEWDEEVNHIAAAAYIPGRFIGDSNHEDDYRVITRVFYLELAIEDEEIERLKTVTKENLKMELLGRKILNIEEVCYYPERFSELYLEQHGDENEKEE